MSDSNRKTAYSVLWDMEQKGAYSNLALNHHIMREKPDNPAFVRELVAELKASDPAFWSNLFLVTREELFCADEDGTIDAAHFNDRGADRCAEAFGKALKKALKL